ncbi:exosortase A [Pseudoduganella ginsengisoli]|uniref:Exosortase A n=1 Tax=Pseudoduganella ginsengisoli TaxID=1462440 RepID=A0A6L6PZ86_9BURK|nr:exosortase A [Pseudoduganella ginsengisoli]MTW02576.1 exosortase A [Pseudoduganella ginsengisoli]
MLTNTPAAAPAISIPSAPPAARHAAVLAAAALLLMVALYFATAASLVAIWNSSETFMHGYVILPISLWLIWRRRDNLALYPPRPYWPALVALGLAGAAWLLARMGEVQVVMQYAFVAMLPLAVLAIVGVQLARSFAFPLLFLLAAVPFGEVLIDPLINFTADFTVWTLQLMGMPVLRNGTHFEIPSGNWSVVEACSGLRYLVSSITLGFLYAYLTYTSTWRRACFVLLSLVVPVIANGLRAVMIVLLGHYSGMTLAVGVDHLIYGWLFFGLVMLLMFWIGGYWREDEEAAAPATIQAAAAQPAVPTRTSAIAALVTVAVAAIWPVMAAYNDHVNYNPAVPQLALSLPLPPAKPYSTWEPRYMPADASISQVVQAADGAPVAVHIMAYRNQSNSKALISSSNKLTGEKEANHVVANGTAQVAVNGRTLALREARISGPEGDQLVWYWLRVGGHDTASNYGGKLWQAWYKLTWRGDDGATVLVSTPLARPTAEGAEAARATLRAFLQAQLPAIDSALQAAQRR